MKKLNIVLPAHNEHNNISPIYKEIILALANCKYPYEILFIDDGSTDDTLAQIKALSAEAVKGRRSPVRRCLCTAWTPATC